MNLNRVTLLSSELYKRDPLISGAFKLATKALNLVDQIAGGKTDNSKQPLFSLGVSPLVSAGALIGGEAGVSFGLSAGDDGIGSVGLLGSAVAGLGLIGNFSANLDESGKTVGWDIGGGPAVGAMVGAGAEVNFATDPNASGDWVFGDEW